MNILYVITGLGIGGAERLVVTLADEMYARGHKVSIVSLTGPVLFRPIENSIPIYSLQAKKTIGGFIFSIINLIKVINIQKPDVIHSHMVHANLISRFVRLFINIPRVICTAHSTNEGGFLRMMGYRATHFLADVTTNVSQEAVAVFESKHAVPKGSMLAILNGVDCNFFVSNYDDRLSIRNEFSFTSNVIVFIAIGRLYDAKDYPTLLKAYSQILLRLPASSLWIVGDGPLRSFLEDLTVRLGISKYVHFFGVRRDIPALLSAADIFVLSSEHEGFGLVVAEAMATETPVIATDCGGVKEVVGDIGILVPISDPNSLAAAMYNLASLSPNVRRELGKASRRHIQEKFGISSVVDRWLEIYGGAPFL